VAGRAWALQGTILAAKGQTEEAIQCHQKQLELYRDNPQMVADLHVLIGTLQDHLGRVQDGIREYRQALQNDPDNPIALNNLAWRLAETGDLENGLTMAQKAVNTAPGQGDFRDTYGWIAYRLSKQEEGAGNSERAASLLKTAVEELRRASQLSPYNPSIRYRTGLALLESGDKTKALDQLRWAVRIGENFPEKAEAQKLIEQTQNELAPKG
jgi:tetratricopeptide (TPR) repeat protein